MMVSSSSGSPLYISVLLSDLVDPNDRPVLFRVDIVERLRSPLSYQVVTLLQCLSNGPGIVIVRTFSQRLPNGLLQVSDRRQVDSSHHVSALLSRLPRNLPTPGYSVKPPVGDFPAWCGSRTALLGTRRSTPAGSRCGQGS